MSDALISYPFTQQGLGDCVFALGTTAEAVVRNLRAFGVKGLPEKECACPLANYVRRSILGCVKAQVFLNLGEADPYIVVTHADGRKLDISGGGQHGNFISLFDELRYADLIEEVSDAA